MVSKISHMSILDKLFLKKRKQEIPQDKISAKNIEQEFLYRMQQRILEYKRFEDCGKYTANCIYMDITEAKDINDHLSLLRKNQKDIGKFFNNMYHLTDETWDKSYGCHRDEVFSEYFNDLCALTYKKIKQ